MAMALLMLACRREDLPATDASGPDSDPPDSDPIDTDVVAPPPCAGPPVPPADPVSAPAPPAFSVEPVDDREAVCVAIEDLDADGWPELVRVDDDLPARARVRWGDDGAETSVELPGPGEPGPFNFDGCAVVDGDLDGRLDVLVGSSSGGGLVRVGEDRGLTWSDGWISWPADAEGRGWRPMQLTLVDLDHEPPYDLIVGLRGRLAEACGTPVADTGAHFEAGQGERLPVLCMLGDASSGWRPDDGRWCPRPVLDVDSVAPHQTAVGDLDGDGLSDAFFALDFQENRLLRGRPGGGFERVAAPTGLEVYDHAMGAALVDLDGDGRRDVYVTDIGADDVYRGVGCREWFQATAALGLPALTGGTITWGVSPVDLDRNGAVDVVTLASVDVGAAGFDRPLCDVESWGFGFGPALVLLNDGAAGFTRHDVPLHAGQPGYLALVRQAWGDVDVDGRPDLLVSTRYGVSLLRGAWSGGGWLRVRPEDEAGRPVPGAVVEVIGAAGVWSRELWPEGGTSGPSELTADFGLGGHVGPFTVRVRFPGGALVERAGVAPGQRLRVAGP